MNNEIYGTNIENIPEQYKPLSVWEYVAYSLLFSIPIIGLISLIVFAFNNENLHRKNYARSYICALVVLIIPIIIFVHIAMQGSQQTIGRAGFSSFTTDIDTVRIAFSTENIPSLIGEQMLMNNAISEAQAYNYLAKGATTKSFSDTEKEHMWLSRTQAAAIPCTRIEKESALAALDIELPVRTVNTFAATGVEMSYFVTNKGDIFVWPPYPRADDGLFYINDMVCVTTPEGKKIMGDDESLMYEDGFEFVVNGVTIKVSNKPENTDNILSANISSEELENMASIYYKDEKNAEAPEGIESKFVYDGRTGSELSEIVGVDKD